MTRLFWTASALAISASLAGCATPNFPIDSAPPPAAAAAPPALPEAAPQSLDDVAPRAAPSERIQSEALPPLLSAPGPRQVAPVSAPPPLRPLNPSPGCKPEPAAEPKPPAPAAKPLASGKVTVDRPKPLMVEKGDTLIGISRKTGVLVAELADLNDLKAPYKVKPGQTIKLPAKRYYTVVSGDTLFAVSRRFSVEAADLAEFNEVAVSKPLRAGQKIYLPDGAKDKGPPATAKSPPTKPPPQRVVCPEAPPVQAEAPAPVRAAALPPPSPQPEVVPATPKAPIPYRSTGPSTIPFRPAQTVPATPAQPMVESAAPPTDTQIAAAGRGRFVWPVRGDVLSRFGPTGGGQRNDGVNILANPGESVRAAGAGEVVYAGNQVPGFGNLVLIKHDGGWVTAYAHMSNIDVKMRQTISQGQTIGQIGQTGSVDQPQLHFEVRYAPTPKEKAKPVDPMLVLPR